MFRVVDATLMTRDKFISELPGELGETRLYRSEQEREGRPGETRPKHYVLIRVPRAAWNIFIGAYWDEEELQERTEDKDWLNVLKSITSGKQEYEMVQANPVLRYVADIIQNRHCLLMSVRSSRA